MLITHYIIVPQCILYTSYCTAGTVCISLLYRYIFCSSLPVQSYYTLGVLYSSGAVQLTCTALALYSRTCTFFGTVQLYLYSFGAVLLYLYIPGAVHLTQTALVLYSRTCTSFALYSCICTSLVLVHFLVSLTLTAYLVRLLRIEMAILLEYLWRELNFYSYPSCAGHG